MSRRVVPVVAVAIACAVAPSARASVDDVSVVEVGTWTRDPVASAPPDGGVAVANEPDGPSTVAAIRFAGDAGGGAVTVRLRQTGGTAPLGAAIRACVTTSPWRAATNGALAAAPKAACEAGAAAFASGANGTWTADVTALLALSSSVVLLPADQSPPLFSLAFQHPEVSVATPAPGHEGDDEAASEGASPSEAPTSAGDAFVPANAFEGVAAPAPLTAPASDLAIPPLPAVAPPATAGAEPAPAADVPGATGVVRIAAPAGSRRGGGRDYAQAARLILLSLAAGGASLAFSRLRSGGGIALPSLAGPWRGRSTGGPR